MSNKKPMITLSLAAGTAFIASLATANIANAAEGANPFEMNELSSGYMQLAAADKMDKAKKDGSCGEGKCGSMKDKKEKKGKKDGKCGEGKCGESK